MAHNNNNHHHHNHNHMQQQQQHQHPMGMPHPQTASFAHFQPWRQFVKTEKDQEGGPESGSSYYGNVTDPMVGNNSKMEMGSYQQIPAYSSSVGAGEGGVGLPQKLLVPTMNRQQVGGGPVVPGNPELEQKMQQCIDEGNCVGDFAKKQIVQILESISLLKPPERVLLYLRMPGANCETDPLRQPQNPLGARSEINHTINWVRSHLEPDPNVSIPKKDVYDDYTAFCGRNSIKPLSTADFGKVMKQVFPSVRPRRLGTRGNSRYCYAAMRKATKLDIPLLPDLSLKHETSYVPNGHPSVDLPSPAGDSFHSADHSSWAIIRDWAQRVLQTKVNSAQELADHIVKFNLIGTAVVAAAGEETSGDDQKRGKEQKRKGSLSSPEKTSTPVKRHRKKPRKKDEANVLPIDGSTKVTVKREVESSNEGEIMDLKINSRNSESEEAAELECLDTMDNSGGDAMAEGSGMKLGDEMIIKLNDVPIDSPRSPDAENDLQIANILCKKVRQAQQAKWQLQQAGSPQPQQQQQSVIVTPMHNFSQPEIPSPSMLNQIRLQNLAEREAKYLKRKAVGGGQGDGDQMPDYIPRERFISVCQLDKDALDDYLPPVTGDNSQEMFQDFDETSSNGQSAGGIEGSSPKLEESVESVNEGEGSVAAAYDGYSGTGAVPAMSSVAEEGEDKLSQLREILHQNYNHHQQPSAAASLSLLSLKHNCQVGLDLRQDQIAVDPSDQPLSLKKRRYEQQQVEDGLNGETTTATGHRHGILQRSHLIPMGTPIAAYPKGMKVGAGYGEGYYPLDMQMDTGRGNSEGPLALISSNPLASLNPHDPTRKTAFSRTKYQPPPPPQQQPPVNILNNESRPQSVPLNYRQSPVQVTSSNDATSWSSSYQNTNNANNSACSSVNPTPIPPDYNDFNDMMDNMWEGESSQLPQPPPLFRGGMDDSQKLFKDKNNNSSGGGGVGTDDLMDDLKSFSGGPAITSRSVPSTPIPSGPTYYSKVYFNGSASGSSNQGQFFNYSGQPQVQQQMAQNRGYDVSKSVPTTPNVSRQFLYSPVGDAGRGDNLINGNLNLEKALDSAYDYGGETSGSGQGMDLGAEIARRRIEKIEEDRKVREEKSVAKLEEELGYDPLDEDLPYMGE